MASAQPKGPHADVAVRFAFLMDAVELDRHGFVEAVDGAITARSLFAILAGDRRPSRALAVLIERTFGFRADHLLDGTGSMWVRTRDDNDGATSSTQLAPGEEELLAFGRRSTTNAQLLRDELDRAKAYEAMWNRALALLADLERHATEEGARGYPEAATAVLEECWHLAQAHTDWIRSLDDRRVVHLTRLFVQRFLLQVPGDLHDRGVLRAQDLASVQTRSRALLEQLDGDAAELDRRIERASDRVARLVEVAAGDESESDPLTAGLQAIASRIERLRPTAI